jgi:hypothetical protein
MPYGALHLRARHVVSNDTGLCSRDVSSEGQRGVEESIDNTMTQDNTKALRDTLQIRRFEYHSAVF